MELRYIVRIFNCHFCLLFSRLCWFRCQLAKYRPMAPKHVRKYWNRCLTPAKSNLTLWNWDLSSEYSIPTSAYCFPAYADFAANLPKIDPWLQIMFANIEIDVLLLLNQIWPNGIEIYRQNIQLPLLPIVSPLIRRINAHARMLHFSRLFSQIVINFAT